MVVEGLRIYISNREILGNRLKKLRVPRLCRGIILVSLVIFHRMVIILLLVGTYIIVGV